MGLFGKAKKDDFEKGDAPAVAAPQHAVIVQFNFPSGNLDRIIDLEELADALLTSKVCITTMHAPLLCLQRFLDNHLHGGKDFPPAAIQPFEEVHI